MTLGGGDVDCASRHSRQRGRLRRRIGSVVVHVMSRGGIAGYSIQIGVLVNSATARGAIGRGSRRWTYIGVRLVYGNAISRCGNIHFVKMLLYIYMCVPLLVSMDSYFYRAWLLAIVLLME